MLIVYNVLQEAYYHKFLHSSLYKKYMNEILMNTEIRLHKTGLGKIPPKKEKNTNKTPVVANSNEEDSLWMRPRQVKQMQLGSIDSTGRFIRNFKSEPDSSEETDSINSQNRFLNGDDDDAWSLGVDSNPEAKNGAENPRENKFKFNFEKLMNFIPLNSRSTTSKHDEQELAERVAASLVNDVIKSNQL